MTTRFISQEDPNEVIVIRRNRLWENVHIYYNEESVQHYKHAYEMREGVVFEIEELGTASLKVHPVTLVPTLIINGIAFVSERQKDHPKKNLRFVTVLFGILACINLVLFGIVINRYLSYPHLPFALFPLIVFGVYAFGYVVTTFFLARRVFFFYFIGSGLFVVSTLYILLLAFDTFNKDIGLLLLVRLPVLGVLIGFSKRAIRLHRNKESSSESHGLIDEKI